MTGLWLMGLLVIVSVSELSFLVHYFTRFSEEIFIGIVTIFFAYEAGLTLYHVCEAPPHACKTTPQYMHLLCLFVECFRSMSTIHFVV